LLYVPVTKEALENAYTFYTIWFESPGAVKVCVPSPTPGLSLSLSLHVKDARQS